MTAATHARKPRVIGGCRPRGRPTPGQLTLWRPESHLAWDPETLKAERQQQFDQLLHEFVHVLELRVEQQPWKGRAACLGKDPSLWISSSKHTLVPGRAYCAVCPVVRECARHVAEHPCKVGTFAGMSEEKRRPLGKLYRNDPEGLERAIDAQVEWLHKAYRDPGVPGWPGVLNHGSQESRSAGCRCTRCHREFYEMVGSTLIEPDNSGTAAA